MAAVDLWTAAGLGIAGGAATTALVALVWVVVANVRDGREARRRDRAGYPQD